MIGATLFSGIGAPEVACPHWDWRWHAEIEKFPSAVMAQRHPRSVNLGDVNAEGFVERASELGRPDVLVFGSPCQDFSVAGRRVGLDGDRGNLALVALGIAAKLRPRWLVFENVPGLLSSYSGSAEAERSLRDRGLRGDAGVGAFSDCGEDSDFAAFLSLVQQCGYLGCYRITDAQFAGVPQRRRRVFFVGHLGDWRPAAAVLLEPDCLRGDHPPSREAGQRVAPTVEARANAGGAGWGTDFLAGGGLAVAGEGSSGLRVPEVRGGQRRDVVADVRMVQPRERECFNESGFGWWSGDEVAQTMRVGGGAGSGGAREATLIVDQGPTPPLNAGMGTRRGSGAHADPLVVTGFEDRVRGDDGRGYAREPNFIENCSPTLSTVKPPTIAFSCKDWGGDAAPEQAPTLRAMGFDGTHANGGGQIAVAFQTRLARNGRGSESDVVAALNGADAGATSDMRPCVAVFKPSHYTRGKDGQPSGVSPPLGAEPDKGDQEAVLLAGAQVRRLTPRECERLQSFPDDYTLVKFRGKPAVDGPRYKSLGNAMNVREIGWVLRRIEMFEARSKT